MKRTYIHLSLIVCFVFIYAASFAQPNITTSLAKNDNYSIQNFKEESNKSTAKATSSGRRLKAESKYYSDGTVLSLSDTLAYGYSKGRIKTNDNNLAFDNMNGKYTLYSNVSVNADQVYDANNNKIGFVYESKNLSTGKLESQGNGRALYNVKNALVSSYSLFANSGMTRYDTVTNVYDADNYISEYYKAYAGYDKV